MILNGNYTLDPLGGTRGVTSYNGFVFPDLTNPYTYFNPGPFTPAPFQCDSPDPATSNPLPPNPNGTRPAGFVGNKIPRAMFDPTVNPSVDPSGLAMLNLYPQSNVINTSTLTNFSDVPVRRLNEASFDIRLDHNFSNKDAAFARFSYDQANSYVPGGGPGFVEAAAFASNQNISNHGRNVAVSETHIFNDRNINQFTAGFNRLFHHILSFDDRSCASTNIGIPGANPTSHKFSAPRVPNNEST